MGTSAGTRAGAPGADPTRGVTAASPLDRFLLSLRARDASEHTLRSYATAVGAYLDWLAERGVDWRAPARTELRAYLARLVGSGARTSVSQRLAAIRSFHRFAARSGLAAGDPWGSIGDAARFASSARVARSASGCSDGPRSPHSKPTWKRRAPSWKHGGRTTSVATRCSSTATASRSACAG